MKLTEHKDYVRWRTGFSIKVLTDYATAQEVLSVADKKRAGVKAALAAGTAHPPRLTRASTNVILHGSRGSELACVHFCREWFGITMVLSLNYLIHGPDIVVLIRYDTTADYDECHLSVAILPGCIGSPVPLLEKLRAQDTSPSSMMGLYLRTL